MPRTIDLAFIRILINFTEKNFYKVSKAGLRSSARLVKKIKPAFLLIFVLIQSPFKEIMIVWLFPRVEFIIWNQRICQELIIEK